MFLQPYQIAARRHSKRHDASKTQVRLSAFLGERKLSPNRALIQHPKKACLAWRRHLICGRAVISYIPIANRVNCKEVCRRASDAGKHARNLSSSSNGDSRRGFHCTDHRNTTSAQMSIRKRPQNMPTWAHGKSNPHTDSNRWSFPPPKARHATRFQRGAAEDGSSLHRKGLQANERHTHT
jgi:hypothetical protein